MEAETITLYRAVSPSEYHQLSKSGQFQYLGGAEGKYFAEYEAHAREGGHVLFGKEHYQIVRVEIPKHVADQFHRFPLLDGIGPARFARMDQLEIYDLTV